MWTLLFNLPSKIKNWLLGLGGVVALLASLKLYTLKREKEAVKDFQTDQSVKSNEVLEDARKASAKEKRDASGLSDGDLADRLRRRTSDWERL